MQFGVSVLGSGSLTQQLCPFEKVILSAHWSSVQSVYFMARVHCLSYS